MTTVTATIRRVDLGSAAYVKIGSGDERLVSGTSSAHDILNAAGNVTYIGRSGTTETYVIEPADTAAARRVLPTRAQRRADALNADGCRKASFSRVTGTLVMLVRAEDQGMPREDGGRWALICDDHNRILQHDDYKTIRSFMADPSEWCGCCAGTETND